MTVYDIRNDSDILLPQPPIDYIITNLITTSSLNIFYGEPGSKKTYSLLHMATTVVNGKDWLGFTTKKSPVLYIDEESGKSRFLKRMAQVINGLSCEVTKQLYYTSLAGFKLDNKQDIFNIESEITKREIKLIIFDALADIMSGDENSKKDIQPIMASLRRIADNTNSAVVLIHHTNKGKEEYRGSSAIGASADLVVKIKSPVNTSIVNFKTLKNRDGNYINWSGQALWSEYDTIFSLELTSPNSIIIAREKYVLDYFKQYGESSVAEILDALNGYARSTIRKTIYDLSDDGKIFRTNKETGNIGAKYKLVK